MVLARERRPGHAEIVSVDGDGVRVANEEKVPVDYRNEERAANNVSESCWDHAVPDVEADGDFRITQENGHWDIKHIRNNVVEAEEDECKNGPPDGDDLRKELASAGSQETGQAHEPVGANGFQEDLIPCRGDGFGGCNSDGFGGESFTGQNAAIADDDRYEKEGTSEVTKKSKQPVLKHFQDGGAAVEGGKRGALHQYGMLAKAC